ncbi:MAG: hypothetical protein ABEH80_10615 [Halobaculum sp.]
MTTDDTDDTGIDVDPFQIESRLTSHGVYVTEFTIEEGDYVLTYESIAADDGVIPHQEIGRVINVLLDLHPESWEGTNVDATVLNLDGETEATWHVEDEWVVDLEAYRISEEAFSERVIDSIDPVGTTEE